MFSIEAVADRLIRNPNRPSIAPVVIN